MINQRIKSFWKNESGGATVEWILMCSFAVALAISTVSTLTYSSLEKTTQFLGATQSLVPDNSGDAIQN